MRYTVTIQPDEGPRLVAEVEIGASGALVKSVTAEATNGAGITRMPAVDFAALARALSATGTGLTGVAEGHTSSSPGSTDVKPVTATRKRKAAAVDGGNGKRPYRKAPPDDELIEVHRQAGGSVPVIADAFKVPPNTVYAWLKGARARGVLPNARDAKREPEPTPAEG